MSQTFLEEAFRMFKSFYEKELSELDLLKKEEAKKEIERFLKESGFYEDGRKVNSFFNLLKAEKSI